MYLWYSLILWKLFGAPTLHCIQQETQIYAHKLRIVMYRYVCIYYWLANPQSIVDSFTVMTKCSSRASFLLGWSFFIFFPSLLSFGESKLLFTFWEVSKLCGVWCHAQSISGRICGWGQRFEDPKRGTARLNKLFSRWGVPHIGLRKVYILLGDRCVVPAL